MKSMKRNNGREGRAHVKEGTTSTEGGKYMGKSEQTFIL